MQTRKLDAVGLSQVWANILKYFVAKEDRKGLSANDFTNELKSQLETMVKNGAEANIIEKVSVNGVELQINSKGVNIVVPTGTLAELDRVGEEHLEDALKNLIKGKADKATTLSGYGITDAYTKQETYSKEETDTIINNAVGQALTGVYVVKGSTAFTKLPVSDLKPGFVYNITDAFTTTEAFVEGAGNKYPAGTNVVYTENGWDVMAGIYDFSGYLKSEDLVDMTEEEINAICVMPS